MESTTVTSKGQVTIPKKIRLRMGLKPGDQIEFIEEPDGYKVKKLILDSPFREWRGYLKHLAGQRSDDLVDEMRGD